MAKYKKLLGDFGYAFLDWEKEFGGKLDEVGQYRRISRVIDDATEQLDPRKHTAFVGVKNCIEYEDIRRTAEYIELQELTTDAIRKRAYRAFEEIKKYIEERWEWILTGKDTKNG